MAITFKELDSRIKHAKIGVAAIAAGLGVVTQVTIIGLPALALTLPLYIISVTANEKKRDEFERATRYFRNMADPDIWKDELSKFTVSMDVHVDSYAKYGHEWYPEYFKDDGADERVRRQRIKAVLGYAHSVLGLGQKHKNVNTFLEGLVLLTDNDYDNMCHKSNISLLDKQILEIARRDRTPEAWFDYLYNTRELKLELTPDQQALITSLDLKAADIKYFFETSKVEAVSLDGISL